MVSKISVVICAYTEKRWDELVAAVTSLQSQTLPPEEILVVIDYNPVLYAHAQEELAGAVVLENSRNKGLAGARNTGWSHARGDIVAFLDDDAFASPDWLEQLVACYIDPEVAGVGGEIVPCWEKGRPSWFPDEFNWVVGCTYRGMPVTRARVRNMIGANMSVRRNILASAGGFRESFGWDREGSGEQQRLKWFSHSVGDEETEFCIRVSQQNPGYSWLYSPLASVQHHVPASRARQAYFLWRCYNEGLGKASLVGLHSAQTGLSAERTYTLKVLPLGVLRGFADTFLHFDLAGILRAGAIVTGLTMTVAGYLSGICSALLLRLRKPRSVSVPTSQPVDVSPPVEVQ